MPIFEYVCEACGTRYEQLARHHSGGLAVGLEGPGACPACGSERRALRFSVFSTPKSNGAASAGRGGRSAESGCSCTPSGCGCR